MQRVQTPGGNDIFTFMNPQLNVASKLGTLLPVKSQEFSHHSNDCGLFVTLSTLARTLTSQQPPRRRPPPPGESGSALRVTLTATPVHRPPPRPRSLDKLRRGSKLPASIRGPGRSGLGRPAATTRPGRGVLRPRALPPPPELFRVASTAGSAPGRLHPPTPRPRHPPLSRGRRRTEPTVTSRPSAWLRALGPRAREVRRGGAGWLRGRNLFPEEGTDRKGEGVGVGKRGGTFFTVFLLLGGGCECAWRGGGQAESCSPRHDAPGRTWSPASAAFLVM